MGKRKREEGDVEHEEASVDQHKETGRTRSDAPNEANVSKEHADGTPRLRLRYVLFSDEAGVFLGRGNGWSLIDGHDKTLQSAPTVANEGEGEDYASAERAAGREVPTFRLVQVVPTLPNQRASVDDLANVSLPRFNEA